MGVYKDKKVQKWFTDDYHEGRRVRECVGTSKREAEQALAIRKAEILQGRYQMQGKRRSPRFDEFGKTYLEHAKQHKRSYIGEREFRESSDNGRAFEDG